MRRRNPRSNAPVPNTTDNIVMYQHNPSTPVPNTMDENGHVVPGSFNDLRIFIKVNSNANTLNMSPGAFDQNNPNFATTLEQARQRNKDFLDRYVDNLLNL
jgi:hypothetical protein